MLHCMKVLLALPLLLAVPYLEAPSSIEADDEAAALLEKAEGRASSGKYREAQRLYKKLAKDFPDTPEGRVGERRARPSAFLGAGDVVRHGDSENRVDIVLMGEGYQLKEMKAFAKLAEDVPDTFRRNKTLGEYFSYFNFIRADLVSADNGVDGFGREYDTALGGHILGTYAGHVGVDGGEVRRMLDELPSHDGQAIVFAKLGVLGSGGGGIATIGGRNMKTTLHEFGHSFGRLSDEYSSETHKRGPTKTNVNVTTDPDPEWAPWKHFIDAKVPGVGMYQGADGKVRGAWRPTASNCIMGAGEFFCPVCREQFVKLVYSIVDPIDRAHPAPHGARSAEELVLEGKELVFEVTAMQPANHMLEVEWWVFPEAEAPRPKIGSKGYGPYDQRRRKEKRDPGRLMPIEAKPTKKSKGKRDGEHEFKLKRSAVEPGRYRVICRVTDPAKLRGDRHAWVLKDDRGLLQSEVGWWVRVLED